VRVKAISLTLASVVFLGASSVAAKDAKSADETETVKEQDDSNVIKCERQAVTGSRARKKRVCLTVAEWRARRSAGQRTADALLQDASRGFPEVN
jgi:hypothetical protein